MGLTSLEIENDGEQETDFIYRGYPLSGDALTIVHCITSVKGIHL